MTGPGTSPPVRENFAADTIDALRHQRVKVSVGEPGKAADVAAGAPLPTLDYRALSVLESVLEELRAIRTQLNSMTELEG